MLDQSQKLLIAMTQSEPHRALCLEPRMANRHGLITGATGTGKTVTLQNVAESFSALGVPVLLTDIKGDLAGISRPGRPSGSIAARIEELGLKAEGYSNRGFPVCFWDANPQTETSARGHPLRTTVSEMGPLLLARLLDLNEVQSGILNMAFRIADEQGLLLLDFKDLRSLIAWLSEHRSDFTAEYGHIAPASIGAIQRGLLRLEAEGAELFFGEPSLDLNDLIHTAQDGRGVINILSAESLMQKPRLYAAVLLWLLSELYENLPEVGDADKPRLVLMFDEAHLLFDQMPGVLLEKVEQVVRLIRSRGVGVYFITQSPADIPETVLAQLGNRVQHALRAYTPRERKALKAAADSFRPNPNMDTVEAIAHLATGEALVSFLDIKGAPQMVEKALILPPEGALGPLDDSQRQALIQGSLLAGRYEQIVDRESAYELLTAKVEAERRAQQEEAEAEAWRKEWEQRRREQERLQKEEARARREAEREARRQERENPDLVDTFFRDVTRKVQRTVTNTVGREIGQKLLRGLLGGLLGGK